MSEQKQRADARVINNLQLVKYVVRRISINLPPSIMQEDLIQVGVIGLIDAAQRFEGEDEQEFKAYATCRIRGQVMDELRKGDVLTRVVRDKVDKLKRALHELQNELMRDPIPEEMSARMGITMDDYFGLLQEARADALLSLEDIISQPSGLKKYITEGLGPKVADPEAEVHLEEVKNILADEIDKLNEKERLVIALYYYEELTLREIGEVLQVTESRVSQVHTQAMVRLERRLKKSFGIDDSGY